MKIPSTARILNRRNPEFGGAAMEYVLVSTFAILAGFTALGFIGKVVKDKMTVLSEKLGVEANLESLDIFKDE